MGQVLNLPPVTGERGHPEVGFDSCHGRKHGHSYQGVPSTHSPGPLPPAAAATDRGACLSLDG